MGGDDVDDNHVCVFLEDATTIEMFGGVDAKSHFAAGGRNPLFT